MPTPSTLLRAVALAAAMPLLLAACDDADAPPSGAPQAQEPQRSIQLAARTDGVIAEVNVEAGDRVRAGQRLARIDVSEQQAELARAEAALREARANVERLEALRERRFVDAASALSARAALEAAESDVELWRTRVAFGRIEASIDGVVIQRLIEPGAAVGRLAPAFELADLDRLVLRVGVSELDAASIRPEAEVEVAIDALGGDTINARVRRVFPAADASSRLVTVELDLPQAHARGVRPGFLARARFAVESRADALAVPAAAVGLGEQSFVMVIGEDGVLERREVGTGVVRGEWREITAGLRAGETIVATSPLDLAAGDRVRVVETAGAEA